MLIEQDPITALKYALAKALNAMNVSEFRFGAPEVVEQASKKAENEFKAYSKAIPSKQDSYQAALALLRGKALDAGEQHLVASVLCEPIKEQLNNRVIGSRYLDALLKSYETDASHENLWRLTWYGLLCSYFTFDIATATELENAGWIKLQTTLSRTWPYIDKSSGQSVMPDWVKVIRQNQNLLTLAAADSYAHDYLNGADERVRQLAEDLGVPQHSWFWHRLVLGAVTLSCSQPDAAFTAKIPRLISLIEERPVFRDEALVAMLTRYHACLRNEVHPELRDFAVRRDVWKNPKLKAAGIATAWNRVTEPVWRMVLGWINKGNLKLFFELIAGRLNADEGRLAFWSQYLNQISWTRLAFGTDTFDYASQNKAVRNLIEQEEGAYARLLGGKSEDAFIMAIGEYTIVEFSKQGNACYIYRTKDLQFDKDSSSYKGSTESDDLKYGYYSGAQERITHPPGWQADAAIKLRVLGIMPDVSTSKSKAKFTPPPVLEVHQPAPQASNKSSHFPAPKYAKFSMEELSALVNGWQDASIRDMRSTKGGRLWVEDPQKRRALAARLQALGFKWANKRDAWYYPEA